ncbi:hypothetical protein E4U55_005185, partial [Claviceps digitariae]
MRHTRRREVMFKKQIHCSIRFSSPASFTSLRSSQAISSPLVEQRASEMFDHTSFQDVFATGNQLPYDRKLQQEIEAHRKHADGVLFIDRVLKALGIQR